MSTLSWYLLALIPVVAVVYVIWSHRKKAVEREAAREERYISLIGVQHGAAAAAGEARKVAAPVPVSKPVTPPPPPAVRRDRFLTQPETLLYYVLKTGLPDHEVFPRVSLAAVIDGTRYSSSQTVEDPWSMRQSLSFAICDKSMQVVAVVQLDGQGARQEMDVVNQRLSAAGVRLVRVSPAAMPRREAVKSLILGPSA